VSVTSGEPERVCKEKKKGRLEGKRERERETYVRLINYADVEKENGAPSPRKKKGWFGTTGYFCMPEGKRRENADRRQEGRREAIIIS